MSLTPYTIVIPQISSDGSTFNDVLISGSNLVLSTDANGILTSSTVSVTNYWTATSSSIYNNNAGNVGIGTANPLHTLDVAGTISASVMSASLFYGTASIAITASYATNGGGSSLTTGSNYPITSSWSNNSLTASYVTIQATSSYASTSSYSTSASYAPTVIPNSVTASFSGSLIGTLSGSHYGTSSWSNNSLTASYISSSNVIGTVISASYALTASYVSGSNSVSASYSLTSSYALTASYETNIINSSSFSTSASFSISSSYAPTIIPSNVNASLTGSVYGTSSWSNNSVTASFLLGGIASASYALTASYVSGSNSVSSSYAVTASYATFAVSASYETNIINSSSYSTSASYSSMSLFSTSASYAPTILPSSITSSFSGNLTGTSSWSNNSLTASYVSASNINGLINSASYSITSSFSVSASYAPNSGTSLTTGSTYPITSSWSNNSLTASMVISSSYAISASYAPSSGGVTGGTTNYIPLWSSGTTLTSSVIYQSGSNVGVGVTNPTNTLQIQGNVSASSFTGSFSGSIGASVSSSYSLSSSYVLSASFAPTIIPNSITASFSGSLTGVLIGTSSWATNSLTASYALTASFVTASNVIGTVISSSYSLSSSYAPFQVSSSYSTTSSYAPTIIPSSITASFSGSLTGTSSWAYNSLTASYITSSNIVGTVVSASYALTASYISGSNSTSASYATTASYANTSSFSISASYAPSTGVSSLSVIQSANNQTYISTSNSSITGSINGATIISFVTQSAFTSQSGTGSFFFNGTISSSNINVGVPSNAYPWGNSMTGSYFSTWNNNTNVSDIIRFFAGAFSASYPIPLPDTRTFASVTTNNSLGGSTVTINGLVPQSSSNANILYLQPLGWATVGATVFAGQTFKNGTGYVYYSSNVGGSTTISSSLGASAFGLGPLNGTSLTQINLSGSFALTFASSSGGTVSYTTSSTVLLSQATQNLSPTIANPIALNTIPSANTAVIPPVYQDGYFSNFTGSNLTNSISLGSISSSGIYVFSGSVGINSGSSPYTFYNSTPLTYYYTPIADGTFATNTITSPNSSIAAFTAVSRSLSGAPYLSSGSSYVYVVTASGMFSPLYNNGVCSLVNLPSPNTLTLTTPNVTTVSTNPTINTSGIIYSSSYAVSRNSGTYPLETDVAVFVVTASATSLGTTAAASGSSYPSFTFSNTSNNRANGGTAVGSQVQSVHVAGAFGQPAASGSLLYYGEPAGYVTSTLTFNTTANTETFLDEANRINLTSSVLYMSGSAWNSSSYISSSDLQVKPGFLVNPGGNVAGHSGYWYPNGFGTTYKYYIRHFKTTATVNTLQLVLTGVTNLVSWSDTATANSMAVAMIFESGDANVYSNCRVYDVFNTSTNLIQANVTPTNQTSAGTNPFSSNIDLYGNNGSGASVVGNTVKFPMRSADGAVLDSTVAAQDEVYVLVRYNGTPSAPLTSIAISKFS